MNIYLQWMKHYNGYELRFRYFVVVGGMETVHSLRWWTEVKEGKYGQSSQRKSLAQEEEEEEEGANETGKLTFTNEKNS